MTDAKVIELFPDVDKADEQRPLQTVGPRSWCPHRRTKLVTESRLVECRDCGAQVDAFSVLEALARDPERWIEHRKQAMAEAKKVQARLTELLRQERNAKARAKSRAAKGAS